MIRDGFTVPMVMKIADIDPRKEQKKNCFTISDKARCIAGSVLEILLSEGVMPYDVRCDQPFCQHDGRHGDEI